MAGAVLAHLALANRIDINLTHLYLVDAGPKGDNLLDPTLKRISEAEETAGAQYWIERSTSYSDEIVQSALGRLVEGKFSTTTSADFSW